MWSSRDPPVRCQTVADRIGRHLHCGPLADIDVLFAAEINSMVCEHVFDHARIVGCRCLWSRLKASVGRMPWDRCQRARFVSDTVVTASNRSIKGWMRSACDAIAVGNDTFQRVSTPNCHEISQRGIVRVEQPAVDRVFNEFRIKRVGAVIATPVVGASRRLIEARRADIEAQQITRIRCSR